MPPLRRHIGRAVKHAATTARRTRLLVPHRPLSGPDVDRIDLSRRSRRLLHDNVVAFWFPQSADGPTGGYGAQLDGNGRTSRPPVLHAVSVSRTLWLSSKLATTEWATPGMLRAAEIGFDILRSQLWDSREGGFVTIAGETGDAATDKHLYSQVMALDALVAFLELSDSAEARRLAEDVLELVDRKFHDVEGGFIEGFAMDWSPLPMGRGLVTPDPDLKTTSTHINAVHVLSAARAARIGDTRPLIEELVDIVDERARLVPSEQMGEFFLKDWSRPAGRPSVSFGHDLERLWMVPEANRLLGARPNLDAERRVRLFSEIVRSAWDRGAGGFYFSGQPGRPAVNVDKHWWVQAEALVACLEMYGRTGDHTYLRYFDATLRWIEERQTDWVYGEWHERIDVLGRSQGRKAWDWKTGYHTARSLLAVIARLDQRSDQANERGQ